MSTQIPTGGDLIDPGLLIDMLDEWRSAGNTLADLSRDTGLPLRVLTKVATTNDPLPALTFARILAGIGEPLRPELKRLLKEWKAAQPQE